MNSNDERIAALETAVHYACALDHQCSGEQLQKRPQVLSIAHQ